ncbi:MAG: rhamnulose-1-phosphate aldolase [Bacteroidales bacterium]|nr:rhamnulose-1-phosphate aldolase [Lentimicrobiaceae bacterium]MDD5696020.1 rhamnulose-1-phosphate aldolase [Bacteroidales bacterium]
MRKVLEDIATVALTLETRGWAEGNAGNISANVTGNPGTEPDDPLSSFAVYPLPGVYKILAGQYFLVSGASIRMRNLAKQPRMNLLLIRISDDGTSYIHLPIWQEIDPSLRPTSEFCTHLSIHEYLISGGRQEKTILHTHVNELIALTLDQRINSESVLNSILGSVLLEMNVMIPKGVGLIPYLEPGSCGIARATVESLRQHDLILWAKHGVIAVGTDLFDCLDKIEIVTKAAKIYFLARPL